MLYNCGFGNGKGVVGNQIVALRTRAYTIHAQRRLWGEGERVSFGVE